MGENISIGCRASAEKRGEMEIEMERERERERWMDDGWMMEGGRYK